MNNRAYTDGYMGKDADDSSSRLLDEIKGMFSRQDKTLEKRDRSTRRSSAVDQLEDIQGYDPGEPAKEERSPEGPPTVQGPDSIDYTEEDLSNGATLTDRLKSYRDTKLLPTTGGHNQGPPVYNKPGFQAVGGILGAGAGYGGSKLYSHLTGNKSALRDLLAGTVGAGVGVAAGTGALKYANAYTDGYMTKGAGAISDYVGGTINSAIPIASLANAPAFLGGVAAGASEKDLDAMNDAPGKGFIPGVGAARNGRRLASTVRRSKEDSGEEGSKAIRNILSEYMGVIPGAATYAAAGGVAGAGLGALPGAPGVVGGDSVGKLSTMGAMAGLGTYGVGILTGAIKAAKNKRRTREDQSEYDSESHVAENILNPVAQSYNFWKRRPSTG